MPNWWNGVSSGCRNCNKRNKNTGNDRCSSHTRTQDTVQFVLYNQWALSTCTLKTISSSNSSPLLCGRQGWGSYLSKPEHTISCGIDWTWSRRRNGTCVKLPIRMKEERDFLCYLILFRLILWSELLFSRSMCVCMRACVCVCVCVPLLLPRCKQSDRRTVCKQ